MSYGIVLSEFTLAMSKLIPWYSCAYSWAMLSASHLVPPAPYPCLGMCRSTHDSENLRVQVSGNTFVHLFELHDIIVYYIQCQTIYMLSVFALLMLKITL